MMMTIQCIGSSPLIVSNYYNITTKHAKRKEKYESKRAFYCCKHVVAIERLAAR
jgi:ubiquitin